jgi:hypothetical protein
VIVTVAVPPALRVPDAGDTVSSPSRLAGAETDQETGPPLAVSVSDPPSNGLSRTVVGDTARVPAEGDDPLAVAPVVGATVVGVTVGVPDVAAVVALAAATVVGVLVVPVDPPGPPGADLAGPGEVDDPGEPSTDPEPPRAPGPPVAVRPAALLPVAVRAGAVPARVVGVIDEPPVITIPGTAAAPLTPGAPAIRPPPGEPGADRRYGTTTSAMTATAAATVPPATARVTCGRCQPPK